MQKEGNHYSKRKGSQLLCEGWMPSLEDGKEEKKRDETMNEGDKISIEEIEGLGWYKLYNYEYGCWVYANENHRIIIDKNSLIITHKYIM